MENMRSEAKEVRRAYMRKWRAANRDKIKKYNARYWEKKAAKQADKDGAQ